MIIGWGAIRRMSSDDPATTPDTITADNGLLVRALLCSSKRVPVEAVMAGREEL